MSAARTARPRNHALLLTLYNTGARVSELIALRRSHVRFGFLASDGEIPTGLDAQMDASAPRPASTWRPSRCGLGHERCRRIPPARSSRESTGPQSRPPQARQGSHAALP